ncbi:hypothetical protein QF001_001693 [Paraburkholderia youngii]
MQNIWARCQFVAAVGHCTDSVGYDWSQNCALRPQVVTVKLVSGNLFAEQLCAIRPRHNVWFYLSVKHLPGDAQFFA